MPLLRTYPEELKPAYQRDVCIPVFIAELFTIAKIWKSKYSSAEKCFILMCYVCGLIKILIKM